MHEKCEMIRKSLWLFAVTMLSPSRIGLRALRASNTRCASTSAEQAQSALVSASEKSQQLLKTVQLHAGNALGG